MDLEMLEMYLEPIRDFANAAGQKFICFTLLTMFYITVELFRFPLLLFELDLDSEDSPLCI